MQDLESSEPITGRGEDGLVGGDLLGGDLVGGLISGLTASL